MPTELGKGSTFKSVESEWMTPFNNYDSIYHSTFTFFQTVSLEMWPQTMFRAVDADAPDKVIKQDSNPYIYIVFATFIVILSLYYLNMIISVLVKVFSSSMKQPGL